MSTSIRIDKNAIETAYSFFHQKERVYAHSNMEWQKDTLNMLYPLTYRIWIKHCMVCCRMDTMTFWLTTAAFTMTFCLPLR